MGKKLKLKEYEDRYGGIPKEFHDRFVYLWKSMKFKERDLDKLRNMIRHILKINKKELSFVFYFIPEATPRARYSRFTNVDKFDLCPRCNKYLEKMMIKMKEKIKESE